MKQSITIILLFTCIFSACRKVPDLSELSSDFIVATNLDTSAKFEDYKTFYIPDTVANLGGTGSDSIITGPDALQLVNAVKNNMIQRGYVFTPRANHPDIGITVSVVKVQNFVGYPGWWDGTAGYWWPWYWEDFYWYWYYYPWVPVVYTYPTGSIIINMIDLKNATINQKFTVIWNMAGLGVLSNNIPVNINRGVDAINQGFVQSPYIQTQ